MALTELVHLWLRALEEQGAAIRIILLDFRKAFDRVDHRIVLTKLANTGLPDFLVNWITEFLFDRKQRVKLGNVTSDWCHIKAGVPQGTLLGPVTFLLHINDLQPACSTVKYVDDSTLWETCDRYGRNSVIQCAADQAYDWTERNHMQINTDKTKEMLIYFGRKPHTIQPVTIKDECIERTSSSKLLGVILNDKLTWHDHVDLICSKASRRLYFITLLKRAGKPEEDQLHVYCSIVRSVLDYASEVWHPGLTKELSDKIEDIQIRAMNVIYPGKDYSEAIKIAEITTLYARREKTCERFYQNIKKDSHKLNYLLPPLRNVTHIRKTLQYEPPKCKTERYRNSPINYGLYRFQQS